MLMTAGYTHVSVDSNEVKGKINMDLKHDVRLKLGIFHAATQGKFGASTTAKGDAGEQRGASTSSVAIKCIKLSYCTFLAQFSSFQWEVLEPTHLRPNNSVNFPTHTLYSTCGVAWKVTLIFDPNRFRED